MEASLKELAKLEKVTPLDGKGKYPSISDSISGLVDSLESLKEAGAIDPSQVLRIIEAKKKDIDEHQKEVYSAMSRLGKTLDKKFPVPLPSYPDLFSSDESRLALERTVALHLLRTGQFDAAETLLQESSITIPEEIRTQFQNLHRILRALQNQDITPALVWVQEHRTFLRERSSPLEFYLHRSQFMRLLLSSHPPNPVQAIAYAHTSLGPFFHEHDTEFKRLLACIAYLPLSRLQESPYADLAAPTLHRDLEPLFEKEYCASMGMSKQIPLSVVTQIGAAGSLARIEKGRRVLRETKNEWSQSNELPIEIPIPPENTYHSIFTCPVSKEQSTPENPPMMMTCGHVIARDSLQKLSKPGGQGGRVKCPYCPNEAPASLAVQMHF
ncbi:CTLH/CRA C-terminal to lish motif domain-containing protein [Mucidula mucida]|nr:CTLH/CRA C-terminal to lish motif domain-containing protein [Mucidula mucida]